MVIPKTKRMKSNSLKFLSRTFKMNKDWIKLRDRFSEDYIEGVRQFLQVAKFHLNEGGKTKCPCKYCHNSMSQSLDAVERHLFCNGISPSYSQWVFHGEPPNLDRFVNYPSPALVDDASNRECDMECDDDEMLDLLNDMQGPMIETEEMMSKCFREYRTSLFQIYLKYKDPVEARQHPPKALSNPEDWQMLCNRWETDEWKEKAAQARASRMKLPFNHRAGKKSFVQKQHELDTMKILESETLREGDEVSTKEIVEQVLGKRSSHIKGLGWDPKPASSRAATSTSQNVKVMMEKMEVVMQQNAEVLRQNAELATQLATWESRWAEMKTMLNRRQNEDHDVQGSNEE